MAELNPQVSVVGGVELVFVAASAAGDSFRNTNHEILVIRNEGASSRSVIFQSQVLKTYRAFNEDHDPEGLIPAGETRYFGPFLRSRYNDETSKVKFTYSSEADLVVAVLKIG